MSDVSSLVALCIDEERHFVCECLESIYPLMECSLVAFYRSIVDDSIYSM